MLEPLPPPLATHNTVHAARAGKTRLGRAEEHAFLKMEKKLHESGDVVNGEVLGSKAFS
jgi:hypothetical protein